MIPLLLYNGVIIHSGMVFGTRGKNKNETSTHPHPRLIFTLPISSAAISWLPQLTWFTVRQVLIDCGGLADLMEGDSASGKGPLYQ